MLSKRSSACDKGESLTGEAGADLASGFSSMSESESGRSRETLLFWRRENLGMGSELGGGELEYVGPAQSSEKERSSQKAENFGDGDGLGIIAIGLLFLLGFGVSAWIPGLLSSRVLP